MSRFSLTLLLAILATTPAWAADAFTLSSPDVQTGMRLPEAQVLRGYGCTGGNVSPALRWSGAPKATLSYAVTVFDPDAPTGHGWWHWLIFNIPAEVQELPRNAGDLISRLAPAGSVQSRTDFGRPGYGGACPPSGHGAHRYQFRVYALDVLRLVLPPETPPAEVDRAIQSHKLAKSEIEALYGR